MLAFYMLGNGRSNALMLGLDTNIFEEINIALTGEYVIYPSSFVEIGSVLYYYDNPHIYSFDMNNHVLSIYSSNHPNNDSNVCMVTDGFRFYVISKEVFYVYHINNSSWTQEISIGFMNDISTCILYNDLLYVLISDNTNTMYSINIKLLNVWIEGPQFDMGM